VDLQLPDEVQNEHPDPLAAAVGHFDGASRRMAELFRAVRRARLEIDGSYRPEIHDESLAGLDWEAFTAEELELLPVVTVVTTGRHLRRRGQGSLSELLRSSRPVRVVVQDEVAAADEAEDLSLFHIDLGHLVMAHREAFAVSSTLARPERLVEGLGRMFREPRPGVLLVPLATGAPVSWRPLLAEAALHGRACPDFLYDPEGGPSWADRFDVDGNPDPENAWPVYSIDYLDDGAEQVLETAFTFADAVALEPAYLRHVRLIPRVAWHDDVQIPLADYVAKFEPGRGVREIPFLWVVDDAGMLQRAVVTRELALACRDRLRGWRVLQELGGFENAYAERAAAAAREAARADAAREREELTQAHAEALASARGDGARESMERLAAALLNREALAAVAPAPAAVAPAAPAAEVAAAPAAPAEAEEEEESLSLDEPYIDTILCTSCNECTNLNNRLFNYDGNKQAFIADAAAGTFAELVKAAKLCPAKCIHPGKPRSGDATATPELVASAAAFN
jgi:ferredoxin